jgi:hypothetical protein
MEIRERPPLTQKTSTAGPLGDDNRDPEASTIDVENVDSGPPWEAVPEIREHPPLTQKNIDRGPLGPHGGSALHSGSERCAVNECALYSMDLAVVFHLA